MSRVRYYVVSPDLDAGDSIRVDDLEAMKKHLMTVRAKNGKSDWRLVISIHGNEDVLSVRGGNLSNRQAKGVYGAEDIRKLFVDDPDFARWRADHGPSWTTLNACQVNKPFEEMILKAFNKPGSKQQPQGLGGGCRPFTTFEQYYPEKSNQPLVRREQLKRLPKAERAAFKEVLLDLNKKLGYFGGPPVPATAVEDYYFDEPLKGAWPKVTVSHEKVDTGISFHNRTQNARFLGEKCTRHLAPMRGRTPQVPQVR